MSGLVLVIDDDEWVSRLLSAAIRDAGYDVVVCSTAQAGLDTASAMGPDCIVCDVDLPDHDGYWVAQHVRTLSTRVSVTPFLFLSGLDDQESRLAGFHVGADVYMTKPFRVDEVVAQVGALVQMASRLRLRRDSFLSIPSNEGTAIEGDLSQMSVATVLTVLEMERRTGLFEVVSKKRRAQLEIAGGFVVQGTVGGTKVSALAALRSMLGWNVGRFSFSPLPPRESPSSQKSIGAFLMEAVRLEDEIAARGDGAPPSKGSGGARLAPPSLGGPPSAPDDIAPPSQRERISRPASIRPEPTTEAVMASARANAPPSVEIPIEIDETPAPMVSPVPSPKLPAKTALRLPPPPPARQAARPPPLPNAHQPPGPNTPPAGTRIPSPPRPAGPLPGAPAPGATRPQIPSPNQVPARPAGPPRPGPRKP